MAAALGIASLIVAVLQWRSELTAVRRVPEPSSASRRGSQTVLR
jgi:hypothetical protein